MNMGPHVREVVGLVYKVRQVYIVGFCQPLKLGLVTLGLQGGSTLAPEWPMSKARCKSVGRLSRNGRLAVGRLEQQQHTAMADVAACWDYHTGAGLVPWCGAACGRNDTEGSLDGCLGWSSQPCCNKDEHSLSSKGLDAWAQHSLMHQHESWAGRLSQAHLGIGMSPRKVWSSAAASTVG